LPPRHVIKQEEGIMALGLVPATDSARRLAVGIGTGLGLLVVSQASLAALDDQSREASARLAPTKGSEVSGTATFVAVGNEGVRIAVNASGLEPGSVHGLHIHEKGDCSAPDATSAGPHFALPDQRHGDGHSSSHHAGDLGNLTADSSGNAKVTVTVPDSKFTLVSGRPLDVVGRAIVIHGGKDDMKSQPSGDSGPRVACGVIERRTLEEGKSPLKPAGS
jgi:Cu-Zn family superoxide dismutase